MPGSHGSLTKAGKVRTQTPKVESKPHIKEIPRIRNKKHYIYRIIEGHEVGQFKENRRRR
ncbi:MAG: 30S ribosomal protein S30e [Promethearchaeota archaeon]